MLVANDIVDDKKSNSHALCYHCGTECITKSIAIEDKYFCCEGCKLVYELLNSNDLCDYYKIQNHPGLSQVKTIRSEKYAYLDNEEIASQLYKFTDGNTTIVTLYIPGIHCSSCMWLLEHLNRVEPAVSESRLNFMAKEVTIHFNAKKVSLRKIVELLATIGYEPYISLEATEEKVAKSYNKQKIFKLGVAGFCFGNIMMLSFPEYLSEATGIEERYTYLFRYINVALALPVFFYAATEFFVTAWKGLRQKQLNIDAPVALAIIITFVRSIYEVLSGTGAGYLDSMSGIVFFMLVGRVVQDRTYKSLSFTRDYKSYFPIAVNVITPEQVCSRKLQDLAVGDIVQLHNDEIVPADAIVIGGKALIDYSFVTGESEPVEVADNQTVYAGGRQKGEQLLIKVVKPVAGSYLTSLWNHYAFSNNKIEQNDKNSAIHVLSKYFTIILFSLAAITGIYWYFHNPAMIINSISAMLIVACPCALLLTSTFTNGNILRIFSNNGLYLRDATVIEQLADTTHIVFDKTGTLTSGSNAAVTTTGHQLTEEEKAILYTVVAASKHPYSKMLSSWLGSYNKVSLIEWQEFVGKGIKAAYQHIDIRVGAATFVGVVEAKDSLGASVYVRFNDKVTAFYFQAAFRQGIPHILATLSSRFKLSLLSGDNNKQEKALKSLFGANSTLLFEQKPIDKLTYVESCQKKGDKITMIGDGLNDAGALQQSNVGITLADDINNFTPSCDAILDAAQVAKLPAIFNMARTSRSIIHLAFLVSIIYNIIGLSLAIKGVLTPVVAAILMPLSTISIVVITSGLGSFLAWRKGLRLTDPNS